ncbi:MAG: hypothetical protein Q4F65_11870 [Propionibacteriaceae bacterium]|nr:hypothetical protein [Propionibacteriaceae bacterium]
MAQADVTTDFEREVLSDGVVTRSEYEEMFSRFSECMASAGYEVELSADSYGRYTYATEGKAGVSEADARCATGTINPLAALYNDFVVNPSGEDPDILRVACLKRHRVVAESYTVEQFAKDMADPSSRVVTPSNPEVARCITDPNA